jgi:ubiquinone/menaquinone biosynthesis C-methylase UbiE
MNHYPFPFPDEYFDAVYNNVAATYAVDKDKYFAEIKRVLKPGAVFIDCYSIVQISKCQL